MRFYRSQDWRVGSWQQFLVTAFSAPRIERVIALGPFRIAIDNGPAVRTGIGR